MGQFKKKPVIIEAMRLPLTNEDPPGELFQWLDDNSKDLEWESGRDETLIIHTMEGSMTARPGDWIIRGVRGELYPCKPDIFEETYASLEEINRHEEVEELRAALWEFVELVECIGPVEANSPCHIKARRVLGERRPGEVHGREG